MMIIGMGSCKILSRAVFSGIPKSYSIARVISSVVHSLIGCCAKGGPDVGFSSYAVPTYGLVSEVFSGFKSQGLRLVPKDIRQGCRHFIRCNAVSFSGLGFGFWAEHLRGAWSISS